MRAANVDLVVETGTDFLRGFALYKPADIAIRADAVVAEQRIYLDGNPERVYSVTPEPAGGVTLRFREGLWWQPKIWLPADDMVMPAVPVLATSVKAAWSDPFRRHALNTWTSDAGELIVLGLTHHDTTALAPYVGTWPWDLFVSTVELGYLRLAAGSMTIVVGEALNAELSGVADGRH